MALKSGVGHLGPSDEFRNRSDLIARYIKRWFCLADRKKPVITLRENTFGSLLWKAEY